MEKLIGIAALLIFILTKKNKERAKNPKSNLI